MMMAGLRAQQPDLPPTACKLWDIAAYKRLPASLRRYPVVAKGVADHLVLVQAPELAEVLGAVPGSLPPPLIAHPQAMLDLSSVVIVMDYRVTVHLEEILAVHFLEAVHSRAGQDRKEAGARAVPQQALRAAVAGGQLVQGSCGSGPVGPRPELPRCRRRTASSPR